ncbi:glycoside hydrolase family 3 N-terminal domain-containing protein [Microbacterium koreense]
MRRAFTATVVLAVAGGVGVAGPVSASVDDVPTADAAGTVTIAPAVGDERVAQAGQLVSGMSTREKAATVVMGHLPATDASALHDYMADSGIGGFILMGANIPASEDQLRAITTALTVDPALPPLIAIDQEGGDVSRLPWDGFPSSVTLKTDAPAATELAFAGRAALLERAGIGVNFGVVADVTSDPGMFIYRRALGTTPDSGASHVAAAVEGEAGSALSTLKHFPGHGAAPGDSHTGIPSTGMSKDAWRAADGVPFAAGIDAGAELLMYGHLTYSSVDSVPASLSAPWHRIAREELGFDGIAITDDLGMLLSSGVPEYSDPIANAVTAIAAGNDMVLAVVGSNAGTASRMADGIAAAAESGALSQERLDEAATRVVAQRLALAAEGRALIPCASCAPVD